MTTAPFLVPRIWRSSKANFKNDALRASEVYDRETLAAIRDHGFDAIWVRCRLRDLMRSTVFPELNLPTRDPGLTSLRTTLERAASLGLKLFLFFNEPLGIAAADPFWAKHDEVRGASHLDFGQTIPSISLCVSAPQGKAFLDEAVASVITELPGLGGVILITASEHHSHCWSHHARFGLDDGIVSAAARELDCPRCRDREPAELVAELTGCWRRALDRCEPAARVLAWNWSWSMWYPDPQHEVIQRLPRGVDLMLDFERGDRRSWFGRELSVDEYSLSFVGPSRRFAQGMAAARARKTTVHAKLQLGTTHEIASVPNLPLIPNLHGKLVRLRQLGVQGAMCTWAIGCRLTMNTFAVKLFAEAPDRYTDQDAFFAALAQRYLGLPNAELIARAWRHFSAAFDLFPFTIRLLYFGPVNIAPGLPLEPELRDQKLRGTWHVREDYGDRWEESCEPWGIPPVSEALRQLADRWDQGVADMAAALRADPVADPAISRRRQEEHGCAAMIGIQMRSAHLLLSFHDWRLRRAAALGLRPPCQMPLDDEARSLMAAELANLQHALPLLAADPRLGFHDEAQGYLYNRDSVIAKLGRLRQWLGN